MKRLSLFLIMLFVSVAASAAPFVVSSPVTGSSVTNCGVYMDALPVQTIAVTSDASGKFCKWDASGLAAGAHSVTLTYLVIDPIWGNLESAHSSPLAFTRPSAPSQPSGVSLIP